MMKVVSAVRGLVSITILAPVPDTEAPSEVPVYRDVLTFPPVRQDIAVVVDAGTPAGEVVAHVRDSGGDLLATCRVFDVYEGPQVGEGRKSLAIHLVFQAPDRTLTDEEADAARERIVDALSERFGATLRG